MTAVLPIALGVGVAAALMIFSFLQQSGARKEFKDDPVQPRLADHVEAYLYSSQDAGAYEVLADAVRREFETISVVSEERALKRLLHASERNNRTVKNGLRRKPTPTQTIGAANALIRLSKEL